MYKFNMKKINALLAAGILGFTLFPANANADASVITSTPSSLSIDDSDYGIDSDDIAAIRAVEGKLVTPVVGHVHVNNTYLKTTALAQGGIKGYLDRGQEVNFYFRNPVQGTYYCTVVSKAVGLDGVEYTQIINDGFLGKSEIDWTPTIYEELDNLPVTFLDNPLWILGYNDDYVTIMDEDQDKYTTKMCAVQGELPEPVVASILSNNVTIKKEANVSGPINGYGYRGQQVNVYYRYPEQNLYYGAVMDESGNAVNLGFFKFGDFTWTEDLADQLNELPESNLDRPILREGDKIRINNGCAYLYETADAEKSINAYGQQEVIVMDPEVVNGRVLVVPTNNAYNDGVYTSVVNLVKQLPGKNLGGALIDLDDENLTQWGYSTGIYAPNTVLVTIKDIPMKEYSQENPYGATIVTIPANTKLVCKRSLRHGDNSPDTVGLVLTDYTHTNGVTYTGTVYAGHLKPYVNEDTSKQEETAPTEAVVDEATGEDIVLDEVETTEEEFTPVVYTLKK